jgi:hypothetical protein
MAEVIPGNVYAAKGGRTTRFWIVLAVNKNTCPMIGIDAEGNIVSAQTYARYHLEARPIAYHVSLDQLVFEV